MSQGSAHRTEDWQGIVVKAPPGRRELWLPPLLSCTFLHFPVYPRILLPNLYIGRNVSIQVQAKCPKVQWLFLTIDTASPSLTRSHVPATHPESLFVIILFFFFSPTTTL